MILYPGLDPVTIFPGTPATGYGFFSGAEVAEGGDKRSAANLMAAAEALTDRANFLGWRCINIVDGGTYTFTSSVSIKNAFTFTGACTIGSTSAWGLDGTFSVSSIGILNVLADGQLRIKGTSGNPGKIFVEQYGQIEILSGGLLNADAGSTVIAHGTVIVDRVVAVGADPGSDNVIAAGNIPKAWGYLTTDGAGNGTVSKGYNVDATVAIDASGLFATVTFERAMDSGQYHVSINHIGTLSALALPRTQSAGSFTFWVASVLNSSTPADFFDLNAYVGKFSFSVSALQ